jgi:uncharacterized protein YndB with AHSA1/START domain
MSEGLVERLSLTVETRIRARLQDTWNMLVDPVRLGTLYWGSTVESDFSPGHPIVWKGTWEGKPFEDKGTILQVKAPSLLQYSHWASSSGPDVPENRSILTWRLSEKGGEIRVTFQHENIPTQAMKDHSEPMWKQLLARMKELLENAGAAEEKPLR